MNQWRVFLIDDHEAIITMLGGLISEMGLKLVGVARNGDEAIAKILDVNPDMVIFDLSLPARNGFEVVEILRSKGAHCRYLAFTGTMASYAIDRLHQMRLDGIVSKMSKNIELIEAIHAIQNGHSYCCELLKAKRSEYISSPNCPAHMLTKREVEVLAFIGEAKTDAEIGQELNLSPTTVQGVRTDLLRKLGLHGSPQLVRFARESGYAEFARRPDLG